MHKTFVHKQYRHLFLKAASIIWENKWLVIPGLFISVLANLGFYELFLGNADNLFPRFNWNFLLPVISVQGLIARLSALNIFATILIFLVGAALVFGLLLLAAWALGALVIFVEHQAKEKTCSLKTALREARPFVWPILFLAIIAKAVSYISLNLISVPLLQLLNHASFVNYIFYFIAFAIFVALSVAVSVLLYYSILFLITEKMPLIHAIEAAMMLFARQWITTVEFGFLLLAINLAATVAYTLFISLLAFPFIIFLVVASLIKSQFLLLAATIALITVFAATLLVATGFIVAFYITSWALLFLNIEEHFVAKLHRWLAGVPWLHKKLFSSR